MSRRRRGPPAPLSATEMIGEVVQLVVAAIDYGTLDEMQGIGAAMADTPGTVRLALDLMVAEARKAEPDDELIGAFEFLLGEAFTALRLAAEHDETDAAAEIAAVRERIGALIAPDALDGDTTTMILRLFIGARLDPGDAIRSSVAERFEADVGTLLPHELNIDAVLAEIGEQFGGDIFAFQAEIVEQATLFPETIRLGFAAALLALDDAALRDAALGWLFDADETIRREAAKLLQQAAETGRLGGISLRRLITLRNWLPEGERPALDGVIRTLRRKGVEPTPLDPPEIRHILATGIDGAGARSLFLFARDGRKQAMLSVLLKLGKGIPDAWAEPGVAKGEADRMRRLVIEETGAFENDLAFVQASLAHGIAEGLEAGRLPPFRLLDVIERAGLASVNPERIGPEALVARLIADIPDNRLGAKLLAGALAASANWHITLPTARSWFEDNPAVSALLGDTPRSAKRRTALILETHLPQRRRYWAETLAWTGFAAQRGLKRSGMWESLALVARELQGDRPLSEIPIAHTIARQTSEVWKLRQERTPLSGLE